MFQLKGFRRFGPVIEWEVAGRGWHLYWLCKIPSFVGINAMPRNDTLQKTAGGT